MLYIQYNLYSTHLLYVHVAIHVCRKEVAHPGVRGSGQQGQRSWRWAAEDPRRGSQTEEETAVAEVQEHAQSKEETILEAEQEAAEAACDKGQS